MLKKEYIRELHIAYSAQLNKLKHEYSQMGQIEMMDNTGRDKHDQIQQITGKVELLSQLASI